MVGGLRGKEFEVRVRVRVRVRVSGYQGHGFEQGTCQCWSHGVGTERSIPLLQEGSLHLVC